MAPTTRFRQLLQERRWQTYDSFCTQFARAAAELAAREAEPRLKNLEVSRRTYARWLAGDLDGVPRTDACRVLEQLLGEDVESLFSTPARAPAEPGAQTHAQAPFPALDIGDLRHIAAALDDARRYLDHDVVGYFRERLSACALDDGASGPRRTLPAVLGLIAAVTATVEHVKANVRADLLIVGTLAAEFAGWLYRDTGQPRLAESWRGQALEWARAAEAEPLQGYVLLKQAQAAWDERNPELMRELAEAVQTGPWLLPPAVLAEAALQEARAHAMLTGDLDAVERKLDKAQELFTRHTDRQAGAASALSPHYAPALFGVQKAICLAEAGNPRRATDVYHSHLTPQAFSRRDYGYFLALMAGTLAAAGEPARAVEAGHEALTIAGASGSVRTYRELVRLLSHLEPWRSHASVRELRAQVEAEPMVVSGG
ncbi:XRE family transcriptional regulator [Embleya sp. NPDC055664]